MASPSGGARPPTGAPPAPKVSDVRARTRAVHSQRRQHEQAVAAGADATLQLNADDYLKQVEEGLNQKLDGDVNTLVSGMLELVRLNKLDGKDQFKVAQEAFQANIRTESMIRAVHSLLSLSDTLKRLDEAAHPRESVDVELARLEAKRDRLRQQIEMLEKKQTD